MVVVVVCNSHKQFLALDTKSKIADSSLSSAGASAALHFLSPVGEELSLPRNFGLPNVKGMYRYRIMMDIRLINKPDIRPDIRLFLLQLPKNLRRKKINCNFHKH